MKHGWPSRGLPVIAVPASTVRNDTYGIERNPVNRLDRQWNSRSGRGRKRLGFSLVELVVVIVIVGVVAAMAVPRVSRGSRGAGEAALRADLRVLRVAITMYAGEHGGEWPAADKKEATFVGQLTGTTDEAGNIGTTPGVHIYGPYLRGGLPGIPVGPNVGADEVRVTDKTALAGEVDEDKENRGWIYSCTTGEIIANTDDLDARGVGFDTY